MLQGGSVSVARPAWLDDWAQFASHLTFDALPPDDARGRNGAQQLRWLLQRGDNEDPYSAEAIREKFQEVTGPVWNAPCRKAILQAVDELDRAEDVRTICDLVAA